MEDPANLLLHRYQINNYNFEEFRLIKTLSASSESYSYGPILQSNSWDSSSSNYHTHIICFDTQILEPKTEISSYGKRKFSEYCHDVNQNYSKQYDGKKRRSMSRNSLHAQDHVLAERKGREKLSQRFIALSALLPSLKKMDKATVLGEAIKYIKQVEERVKMLEEKARKRKSVESSILIKKSHLYEDDDDDHDDIEGDKKNNPIPNPKQQLLPEIEVRISDKEVVMRIHSEKQDGLFIELLREIETMNLTVINTNSFPFGNSTQYMIVVAQMESEFCLKPKDLVRRVEEAIIKFISHSS